jgi:hypothetical protein
MFFAGQAQAKRSTAKNNQIEGFGEQQCLGLGTRAEEEKKCE